MGAIYEFEVLNMIAVVIGEMEGADLSATSLSSVSTRFRAVAPAGVRTRSSA